MAHVKLMTNDFDLLKVALENYKLSISQSHLLKQRLIDSLSIQQNENYNCLISDNDAKTNIPNDLINKIDYHLQSIDELLMWLSHHSNDLSNHRNNIKSMENNNTEHSLKMKNQNDLINVLQQTIEKCQMKKSL